MRVAKKSNGTPGAGAQPRSAKVARVLDIVRGVASEGAKARTGCLCEGGNVHATSKGQVCLLGPCPFACQGIGEPNELSFGHTA